ncbi:MAG: ribonuclease HII [Proteobacteria bacterium]|nr:ribonuclease HII [Pseudomonadota bacterium]
MPDLRLETEAGGVVAGVDEVGRGPWAGPVVAAAVILDVATLPLSLAEAIDDSKRLSARRRRDIAQQLRTCARIGIGAAATAEISALNILGATFLAMRRAVGALDVLPDLALVDGNRLPPLPCPARTIANAAGISLSIAAASIIAKVTRDRLMVRLGARYPGFGWERNAGYGTAEHQAALNRLGVTPHHRKSFAPIVKMLSLY